MVLLSYYWLPLHPSPSDLHWAHFLLSSAALFLLLSAALVALAESGTRNLADSFKNWRLAFATSVLDLVTKLKTLSITSVSWSNSFVTRIRTYHTRPGPTGGTESN